MAGKLQMITNLYQKAIKEVTASPENWMTFLDSACRNYRLSFDEQLLVHVQRPDATAVLEIEQWNKRFGRWVKKGSKGIAVLDKSAEQMQLKFYFDISDTQESRYKSLVRPVPLWEVKEDYRDEVRETLIYSFSIKREDSSLDGLIMETAENVVTENMIDYQKDLSDCLEGSLLEELDEQNIYVKFRDILESSVMYMLLKRCGYNASDYFEPEDFAGIKEFDTPEVVHILGTATSDMAELPLGEIADTIVNRMRYEKKKYHTFAYRKDDRYSVTITDNIPKGGISYDENHIQQKGGLSFTGSDRTRGTRSIWEVRIATPDLSEGEPLREIPESSDTGQTKRAFVTDTADSNKPDGAVSTGDGGNTERNGTVETRKSAGVGRENEQYPERSGGSGVEGTDLQLADWDTKKSDSQKLPNFSLDLVEGLLCYDEQLTKRRFDIQLYFQEHEDYEERTEYIKNCYQKDVYTLFDVDNRRVGYKAQENGLWIWEGEFLSRSAESVFSWAVVQKLIADMIERGVYYNHHPYVELPAESQQLSLFDMDFGLQMRESIQQVPKEFQISQQIIDEVLCSGGNKPDSVLRICANFMHGKSVEDNAEFLRKEFGEDGKGFLFESDRVSAWYDVDGIHIAKGNSVVRAKNSILVSWEQAGQRINTLLNEGRYASGSVLAQALPAERMELAKKLCYLEQDSMPDTPLDKELFQGGYPEKAENIAKKLEDKQSLNHIIEMLERFVSAYQNDKSLLRFHSHKPEELLEQIKELRRDPVLFEAQGEFSKPDLFISQDEIDQLLIRRGSGFEDGKFRIFSHYLHDHTEQEHIQFLKDEYGTGGTGWTGYNEAHDAKGIVFSRGNLMKPYDKVTLNWRQVSRRLEELIRSGRYLSEKELEYLPEYELDVLAGRIYNFFYNQPEEVARPYPKGMDYQEAIKIISSQLKIEEKVTGIFAKMEQILDNTADFDRNYDSMQKAYEDLKAYRNGTYSLFPNLSERKLQKPSDHIQEQKEVFDDKIVPKWEKQKKKTDIQTFDLYPDIPKTEGNQYHITNDELGYGTPKEKFRANIKAIQLLKKCEKEGRYATPEEQEILANYVGWGGLSEAFDENKAAWGEEYLQLKTVLNEEEYEAAKASTLTAFYTPPVVIRAMYQVFENMGLQSGNLLEPSCGIGNFIGMKPENLSDCKIYGVELDSISGRIAGQLYQKSIIAPQGYETVDLPDSFFDVAIGNVPFGQFKVSDKRYDRNNFLIHDYFFAKTLDKVRPGGVIAFITSSGTMDKKNPSIRKYIAERAELLGAIRLPNNTFQRNAGTRVTSDILFFQKRDHVMEQEPEWIYLDNDENGITMNCYFVEHPEMILGDMVMESGPFGMESTCKPKENRSLESQLQEAIQNIHAEISAYEVDELVEEDDKSIPANPGVANFSFSVVEGKIYYRENSHMKPVKLSATGENRVKGMIAIRDCTRKLIAYQTEDYSDEVIRLQQEKLNDLYDTFHKRYGLINSRGNSMVFSEDNSYPLLCSLEILNEDGTLARKADMFTKRTIKPHMAVQKVDSATEALAISLAERACVDMEFMQGLTEKGVEEIEQELTGVIFRLPEEGEEENPVFVTEDEYLSGNVREKLKIAKLALQTSPIYQRNVDALEKVIPKDLTATEITVRLGTVWIPEKDIEAFVFELLATGNDAKWHIKVHYSNITGEWSIEGKSFDKGNVKANSTYGTKRANAYRIIEDSLNLRDTRIYDYEVDENGKRKAILNKKETAIAQGKQEIIKQAFEEWIWKEPERRERLVRFYNDKFNAIRPRQYNGSYLKFEGINPEITLREHQKNGVARIIYGGNTLLAHVVGAGKTYTMVAAVMEMKRLGLCHKSMINVPNHIIDQFAAEWLQLYPAANILVATKKSFEKKNRKKFCARIATGDYDAVIIGHSQFEKIPVSPERQVRTLEAQKAEIVEGIQEAKRQSGQQFTVKQMEKTKRSLDEKLKKLNNQERKDDVIYFEQLGVDRMFVDEADNYKNLYLYTKMRNVGGIAQTEAQKSSDMFMKCRYMDELTGGKGIIFATGTPISNSMVELYTMQRYLQYNLLAEQGFLHFDAWAAQYGETVTAIELAPEGTGYRMKTRFAKFNNIPELMAGFKEVADIQTEDMLQLDVPKANYRVITVKPSKTQKEMVAELAARAERVRNGMVAATDDNMLLITNDGRKLALDQRLINELLPDEEESKINACVKEIVSFWNQGKDKKLTQLVFSDLSTPKSDGSFNVYDDLRKKLVEEGIPREEVAFIHEATTDTKKKELFAKVRNGTVRVLIGSTFKMGAGTNVQDLLIASHDLDCPWRPRDLEQRRGRSIRQGNHNKEVDIIRYITEGTFDAYLYQVIENKQKFISQIMTSKSPARSVEDVDMTALSYAEIKALASGNPEIKEKMDLDVSVSKLQLLKQSFLSQKYELESKILNYYPKEIKAMEQRITCYEKDRELVKNHTPALRETFPLMEVQGGSYAEKAEAGKALIEACKSMTSPDEISIGSYRGLQMGVLFDSFSKEYKLTLRGNQKYQVTLGTDIHGNITRIDNAINSLADKQMGCKNKLEEIKVQYENAKQEVQKPFSKEKELREKSERLEELNALLSMDDNDLSMLGMENEPTEPLSAKKEKVRVMER